MYAPVTENVAINITKGITSLGLRTSSAPGAPANDVILPMIRENINGIPVSAQTQKRDPGSSKLILSRLSHGVPPGNLGVGAQTARLPASRSGLVIVPIIGATRSPPIVRPLAKQ